MAELGLVAGGGMVIGWFLAMTLLPALMVLARPASEAREVGYPALGPVDSLALPPRAWRLLRGLLLALACIASLGWLRFDTNPINLRDPGAESVATWRDLARSAETNPNTLEVLAPDLAAAQALARTLAAPPRGGARHHAGRFHPRGAGAEARPDRGCGALLLGPALSPDMRPAPDDLAVVAASAPRRANSHRFLARRRGWARRWRGSRGARWSIGSLRRRHPARPDPSLAQLGEMLAATAVTLDDLPADLRADWMTADGRARIEMVPNPISTDETTLLRQFALAVRQIAPEATGLAVSMQESSTTIQLAFIQSGVLGLIFVLALLVVTLRSLRLSLLALAPLALAGLMTMAHCALFGPDLNLANITALPLLFGQGVAYDIYFVAAWQQGRRDLLASPLNRAVIYSAVTNAAAFGALALSRHPGTASMGVVLSVSLVYSLACVMLVLPPLLRLFASPPVE